MAVRYRYKVLGSPFVKVKGEERKQDSILEIWEKDVDKEVKELEKMGLIRFLKKLVGLTPEAPSEASIHKLRPLPTQITEVSPQVLSQLDNQLESRLSTLEANILNKLDNLSVKANASSTGQPRAAQSTSAGRTPEEDIESATTGSIYIRPDEVSMQASIDVKETVSETNINSAVEKLRKKKGS